MRKVMTLVVTVTVLACLPGRAFADPVRASSASDLNRKGDLLGLLGLELLLQQWFDPGRSDSDLGLWHRLNIPQSTCDGPCIAGDIVSLSLQPGPSSGGGTLFGDVAFGGSPEAGAALTLPALVTAADFDNPGTPLPIGILSGGFNGPAFVPFLTDRAAFAADAAGPGLNFESPSASPEPGTILLFGLGAAVVARRARRSRVGATGR